MRYLFRLSYMGTRYHGWQVQHNAHSVQAELNKAISTLLNIETETLGCGRTDTGVHASQFYAQFDAENIPQRFLFRLNQVLPADIAVYEIWQVKDDFNVRFDALYRVYEYHLHTLKDPFLEGRSYFRYGKLNFAAMNQAAETLLDVDDFESFSKTHTQVKTFRCKVMQAQWEQTGEHHHIFTIKADRFLRNMVRAIVGTLMEVGTGRMDVEGFRRVVISRQRTEAGQSMPACGLYLTEVGYDFEAAVIKKL